MSALLAGQVGVVTGAGRGIGRAVALGLAAHGMAVAVQARTAEQVEQTVELIEAAGGVGLPVAGDVTDPAAVSTLRTRVDERLGAVDLLVNNAGVTESSGTPLWETDPEEWWQVVAVNLRGPMLTAAAVLPDMIRRRSGRVVNMNSLAASRSDPGYSAYGAAKAGLARVTDSLSAALEGSGVSVFDISPGLVRTAMTQRMAMWHDVPDERWTPVERAVDLVIGLAAGRADILSGRFIHATDDLGRLVAQAARIRAADGRKLRLRRYASDDPLPD